jgi:DNA-binding NarL/FixJ family response regulator
MNDRVLRVIVADDHPVFRQGLRASLSAENDIEVVEECGDGPSVVANAITARPDVVLMDIRMPEMNGIEATRRIISTAPDTRILMLTMFDDDESVFEAMRAGARGYFGPAIAGRMMALFTRRTARPFPVLTEREHAVLEMIAEGRNNQAIAHELELSVKTVRNYVSMIFNKLQVADRAEAMLKAHAAGLGRNQA